MDADWIQIRPGLSWHVIKTWSRMPGVAVTLCGRRADGETRSTLPAQRSCETCLRILTQKNDA